MTNEVENSEKIVCPKKIIEYCGTPFHSRHKFLIHNGIEDLITAITGKKTRGHQGITDYYHPHVITPQAEQNYYEETNQIRKMLTEARQSNSVYLIQDGALAGMTLTEILRRAGVLAAEEAMNHTLGLLPFAKMEDHIIVTLVSPRAALTRASFPPEIEGFSVDYRQQMFVYYTVYNEALKLTVANYSRQLPPVHILEFTTDEFEGQKIFDANAELTLQLLGLSKSRELLNKLYT